MNVVAREPHVAFNNDDDDDDIIIIIIKLPVKPSVSWDSSGYQFHISSFRHGHK